MKPNVWERSDGEIPYDNDVNPITESDSESSEDNIE
jgi:hypothetical protein